MTRVHYNPSSSKRGDISTTDTWPVARNKGIKLNSTSNSGRDCYDPHERNIYTPVGGEVVIHNKFSLLEDYNNSAGKQPPRQSPNSERGGMGDLSYSKCQSNNNYINNFDSSENTTPSRCEPLYPEESYL